MTDPITTAREQTARDVAAHYLERLRERSRLMGLDDYAEETLEPGGPFEALERAWDTVLDDGWEGADRTRLDASRAARAKTLNDKLATRVLKAPTERALRLAWNAATKAGRADELAPMRTAALSRLGLEDPEAASLAA